MTQRKLYVSEPLEITKNSFDMCRILLGFVDVVSLTVESNSKRGVYDTNLGCYI